MIESVGGHAFRVAKADVAAGRLAWLLSREIPSAAVEVCLAQFSEIREHAFDTVLRPCG